MRAGRLRGRRARSSCGRRRGCAPARGIAARRGRPGAAPARPGRCRPRCRAGRRPSCAAPVQALLAHPAAAAYGDGGGRLTPGGLGRGADRVPGIRAEPAGRAGALLVDEQPQHPVGRRQAPGDHSRQVHVHQSGDRKHRWHQSSDWLGLRLWVYAPGSSGHPAQAKRACGHLDRAATVEPADLRPCGSRHPGAAPLRGLLGRPRGAASHGHHVAVVPRRAHPARRLTRDRERFWHGVRNSRQASENASRCQKASRSSRRSPAS
jgi:hypothetical protein